MAIDPAGDVILATIWDGVGNAHSLIEDVTGGDGNDRTMDWAGMAA